MEMKWFLRTLPASINLTEGNALIISYINGILNPIPDNTGISIPSGFHLSVFPTISTGEIEVTGTNENGTVMFTLMDVLGKRMMNRNVSAGERIQLHELNNGIYFYRLASSDKYFTGKIILKK